jgi:hypothetical protein
VDPTVVVGDSSVHEGDSGVRIARVMVTLDAPAAATVTVRWVAEAGSATSPADFKARSGGLVYRPGQTTRYAVIRVKADTVTEGDETFTVSVTEVVGATIGDGTGTVTILDEEGGSGAQLSIGSASVAEGDDGAYQFVFLPVTLRSPSASPVTVAWATSPDSATAPADYLDRARTITFPAGTRVRWVLVYVTSDGGAESDETFDVVLSSPTGATILDGTGTVTIVDDD